MLIKISVIIINFNYRRKIVVCKNIKEKIMKGQGKNDDSHSELFQYFVWTLNVLQCFSTVFFKRLPSFLP